MESSSRRRRDQDAYATAGSGAAMTNYGDRDSASEDSNDREGHSLLPPPPPPGINHNVDVFSRLVHPSNFTGIHRYRVPEESGPGVSGGAVSSAPLAAPLPTSHHLSMKRKSTEFSQNVSGAILSRDDSSLVSTTGKLTLESGGPDTEGYHAGSRPELANGGRPSLHRAASNPVKGQGKSGEGSKSTSGGVSVDLNIQSADSPNDENKIIQNHLPFVTGVPSNLGGVQEDGTVSTDLTLIRAGNSTGHRLSRRMVLPAPPVEPPPEFLP